MLITYPIVYVAQTSLTYAFRQPVPIRYACQVLPPGLLSLDTDGWNCNLCGSAMPFYAPFERGDIIPFQTSFADNFNLPNTTLAAGFKSNYSASHYVKIELQDGNGVTITDFINAFCETYWVGHSLKTGSLQTWFLNTGLLPTLLKCFRLKITYYRNSAAPVVERVLYTEYYKEFTACNACQSTVIIKSTYADFDCNGNYYNRLTNILGNGNLAFYNSMRILGEVEYFGDTESATTNDLNVVISKDITENFMVASGACPPYFIKRLAQTVRGNSVTVNEIEYQNFSYDAKPEDLKMFLLSLSFDKKCQIDNRKCE